MHDFTDNKKITSLVTNKVFTNDNIIKLLERNFVSTLTSRNLLKNELSDFQPLLNFSSYAYFIAINISSENNIVLDDPALQDIIYKSIPNKTYIYAVPDSSRINILVSIAENSFDDFESEYKYMPSVENLFKNLINYTNADIKIGFGNVFKINKVLFSYTQAIDALNKCSKNEIRHFKYFAYDNSTFDFIDTIKKMHFSIITKDSKAFDYLTILLNIIQEYDLEFKHNKALEILTAAHISTQSGLNIFCNVLDYNSLINELSELNDDDFNEWVYKHFSLIVKISRQTTSINFENKFVKSAKEYLEINYKNNITLDDIAKHVNISPQYFSKLIKKSTGYNFVDWLSMIRVRKAKELFINKGFTIKEVCYLVGYKDPNYFSRIFKKRTGMTPSEYIKLYNNL